MGRWSRLLAPRFVSWLPVRPAAHWLDIGCGTGALEEAICADARPTSVVACDPSESFVEYARQHQADPRVSFVVAAVGHLPTRPGGFDSVTSLLALNFFPKPDAAIEEMRRITDDEWRRISMRLGLCGSDGVLAALLGFRRSLGSQRDRSGRRPPLPGLSTRCARIAVSRGRSWRCCLRGNRDTDPILHVRRVLDSIPGRHRSCAHLRCKPRTSPPRVLGAASRSFASSGTEWLDLPGCQCMGCAWSRDLAGAPPKVLDLGAGPGCDSADWANALPSPPLS